MILFVDELKRVWILRAFFGVGGETDARLGYSSLYGVS